MHLGRWPQSGVIHPTLGQASTQWYRLNDPSGRHAHNLQSQGTAQFALLNKFKHSAEDMSYREQNMKTMKKIPPCALPRTSLVPVARFSTWLHAHHRLPHQHHQRDELDHSLCHHLNMAPDRNSTAHLVNWIQKQATKKHCIKFKLNKV